MFTYMPSNDPAMRAAVDQRLAAITHARSIAPRQNSWLADPVCGDPWTEHAVREAATSRPYFEDDDRAVGAARPLTVSGNEPWPDAEAIEGPEEEPLAVLGRQECGRCLSLHRDLAPMVRNVVLIPTGITVVECAYCDACAAELDDSHSPTWKIRSNRASV